jgi:hypothetical protein
VKSDGDFEDILAADKPDVWVSNRPAKTGEAGEMLAKIIEKAVALKSGRKKGPDTSPAARARRAPRALGEKKTRKQAPAAARKKPSKQQTGAKRRS